MMTDEEILSATRAIIERVAGASRMPVAIGPETRLDDGFWLDSVDLLEVIVACEHEFGIAFDEGGDLEKGGLQTLGALTALIRARQSADPRTP